MTGQPTGRSSSSTVQTHQLRRRTPGSFLLVPSPKDGRSIRCQGQLEGEAAMIFTASPSIVRITEQPLRIHYEWKTDDPDYLLLIDEAGSKPRTGPTKSTYTIPDFLIVKSNGERMLIEIKPAAKLSRPDVIRKRRAVQCCSERLGLMSRVLTEHELRGEPLNSNVRLLSRYRTYRAEPDVNEQITQVVCSTGITIAAVLEMVPQPNEILWRHLLSMLARDLLACDLARNAINADITLYPKGAFEWDPFESVWALSGSTMGESTVSPDRSIQRR